jgi:hypothetical protein
MWRPCRGWCLRDAVPRPVHRVPRPARWRRCGVPPRPGDTCASPHHISGMAKATAKDTTVDGIKVRRVTYMGITHDYVLRIPRRIPAGHVLVHNHIWPPIWESGFRAWLVPPDPELIVCDCGWAPRLKQHFRNRPRRPL